MARRAWNLDIDRALNRLVPPPPWGLLPYPVARFLGHRRGKPEPMGNVMIIFWASIGIFCSIAIIEVVGLHIPSFQARGVPLIVGSFGAAAVLEFYAIESPLAQPRNAIIGQALASVVGVAVCRLFALSPHFDAVRWAGGALACAAATALMGLTKTVHPPAGATALLAVADPEVAALGWFLVPVMLLGCGLMLAVALLVNNVERQFPAYWWTPEALRPGGEGVVRKTPDEAKDSGGDETPKDLEAGEARASRESRARRELVLRPGEVRVPEHLYLRQEELQWLESISARL